MKFLKAVVISIITFEARLVLAKYRPKVIAVTGTVGKTSTKDAIYTALAEFFYVRKSEKSMNTEIGVPLSILGAKNPWRNPFRWLRVFLRGAFLIAAPYHYPKVLVLEVGADRPGDIRFTASWLRPDVAVVTRFAKVPVHVEFFPSAQELLAEKRALVEGMRPGGVVVLNGDDEDVKKFRLAAKGRVITYGMLPGAEVCGSDDGAAYEEREGRRVPVGVSFKVQSGNTLVPVSLRGGIGRGHVYPLLAAFAVCLSEGLNPVRVAEALRAHETAPGRMRLLAGVKGTVLIDDSYNASPVALSEALIALSSLETAGRRIAILGDMTELGRESEDAHRAAGAEAARVCDILVTVGMRARGIAEGSLGAGFSEANVFQYEDAREAGKFVETLLLAGDTVLVKGSQAMRMERAVEELMAEPGRAGELLVRQEREWKLRR